MSQGSSKPAGILDRLHPDASVHRAPLTDRIRRDLEELLNARRPWIRIPPDRQPVEGDVLLFGVPHTAELSLAFQSDDRGMIEALALTLRQFESRLVSPQITLDMDPVRPTGVRFRVRAHVRDAGAREVVDLDARLVPERNRYMVDTHR